MHSSSYTEYIHTMSTDTILYCAYSIPHVCMYKCYIDDISEDDDVYIPEDVCGMRPPIVGGANGKWTASLNR